MIDIRSELGPDLVIGPCSDDRHQDHSVVHQEMLRAFARQTVLGHELSWNCTNFEATCHLEVTDGDVAAKVKALSAYRSQEGRYYITEDYLRSCAVFRGTQVAMPLAEAYQVLHWRLRL